MHTSQDNLNGTSTQPFLPDEDTLETMEEATTATAAAAAAPPPPAASYEGAALTGPVNVAVSASTGHGSIASNSENGVQQQTASGVFPGAMDEEAAPSIGYGAIDSNNLNGAQQIPNTLPEAAATRDFLGELPQFNKSGAALPEAAATRDELGELPQFHNSRPGLPGAMGAAASPSHRKTRSMAAAPTHAGQHRRRRGNPHHRRRSSIGEFLEVIGEDAKYEAKALKSVWTHELEEGDLGQRYFLDMNITRSLSILPEDILEFADEAVNRRERRENLTNPLLECQNATPPPIPHTPTASLGSYLALGAAVLAVSSNGTAVSLLHDVHPAMRLFWRMTAVSCVLTFFAIKTMANQYREEQQFFPKLTLSQWLLFGAAAVSFFLHALLLFTALTLTSIGNAVIMANSQALLLVLGKALTGHHVVFLEGMGVLIAFGGCVLCSSGEATEDKDGDGDADANYKGLLGDFLAFLSAVTGVFYLTFAKAVRPHIPVTVFMFMVMVSGFVLSLAYIIVSGIPYTLDNDPNTGLFGWATLVDNHIFIILYIAIICNLIGTMGFVRAMEYFDNIIIAVATLLEPMLATMIAYFLGVGDLPGTMGWIGNFLVALGTLGVVYPSMNDKDGGAGGH